MKKYFYLLFNMLYKLMIYTFYSIVTTIILTTFISYIPIMYNKGTNDFVISFMLISLIVGIVDSWCKVL